ncbi:MAG TPA: DUF4252 domain-containing protein [Bryobacteraceae bacterium]|jgi:hypothetical protein|nr:DUF4252 domain-containing protein [Bryobacteraceae bacterium]
MTKTLWILLAGAMAAFAQQGFDFKSLDKLGANATESANITLDGNTLKLAAAFLSDKDVKDIVTKLKGVYIRSFEFAKPGQYKESDLAPLRAYLKSPQWMKIVDVKEAEETSEIWLRPLATGELGGLAIISAETKEVSIVFIEGTLRMSDIGKLSGNLGIPDIDLPKDGKKSGKKE